MPYILRSPSLTRSALAASTPCIVRPFGAARAVWDALWSDGSTLIPRGDGSQVLRFTMGEHTAGPTPAPSTPPAGPVLEHAASPVAFATMGEGGLTARRGDGTAVTDDPQVEPARWAWVLRGGVVRHQDVRPVAPRVARALAALPVETLARAPVGAVVAAPDGTTLDGAAVWRVFTVAADGSQVLPLGASAPIPAGSPAAVIADMTPGWLERTRARVAAGGLAEARVTDVAGDGSVWLAPREANAPEASTAIPTTAGSLAPAAGHVVFALDGSTLRPGALCVIGAM